jgi:hypothetical protein
MTDKKEATKDALAEGPKAAEAPPERVTATYRGPHDALVLEDGTVLLLHVETATTQAAIDAARTAGHLID